VNEAADAVVEATDIYLILARENSNLLPSLIETLGFLSDYCRKAGRAKEIDGHWKAAVDSQDRPAGKALPLVRRASQRELTDPLAAEDLVQANSYLSDTDRELAAELHKVSRSRRAVDPASFDATWKSNGGGDPPDWLTVPQSCLELVVKWLEANDESLEASREYLQEKIGEIPAAEGSVALDEIALYLPDPRIIENFRKLLQSARELGIDEAYRPQFALRLLSQWMDSNLESTRTLLRERRGDLLNDDVTQAMQSLLAQFPEDATLQFHEQLLELARVGNDDLAFELMEDPAKVPAKLFDLVEAGDSQLLYSLATVLFLNATPDSAKAIPCFYRAIAQALRNQPDEAQQTATAARRLDPTQDAKWLALLFKMPGSQRDKLAPLSDALTAPLPPDADDA
jgi:hypothetical protein